MLETFVIIWASTVGFLQLVSGFPHRIVQNLIRKPEGTNFRDFAPPRIWIEASAQIRFRSGLAALDPKSK